MTTRRTIGIDIGAETIKAVELQWPEGALPRWTRRKIVDHNKEPAIALIKLLDDMDLSHADGAAVTGRLSRTVNLKRIPTKQSQKKGYEFIVGSAEGTVVSIGSHGFSVLEIRNSNVDMYRENTRCSQGTGNFLRQLVGRFELDVEQASILCAGEKKAAPLSGRCPVILKTDMTHLANKGEPQERILAGLYDAVCENVQVLIKPRVSPKKVVLIGGVTQSTRIQNHFKAFLSRNDMDLHTLKGTDNLFFEAVGAACIAAEAPAPIPTTEDLVLPPEDHHLEHLPPLSNYIENVTRMKARPPVRPKKTSRLVLGFDIGSTGSKVVAVDTDSKSDVWTAYTNTNGAPVMAAQHLMEQFARGPCAHIPVVAVGTTGSGREIVGSLLTTCYGKERVFVLNEIAAHAEGALHFNDEVDTIFEIGGQDAKYIRLSGGRIIDAAMNEACSAGTGSFIEEQGRKFSGIDNVVQLADEAIRADGGVSLGQHCSVFMAEIIDEAVASHVPQRAIIAGIYDSIIQNYVNRVKGSRQVGDVIFCQGMPFASDALAAAVARQTGAKVIVPPNPGTVGALGIGLLTLRELDLKTKTGIDPQRFLKAHITRKDVFTCKSTKGCGGNGNYCRIDRITTVVEGVTQKFTWGGGCSLYDKGAGKKKLPDLAPNPFREREALVEDLLAGLNAPTAGKTVAITDEFVLKSIFPFFATFLNALGFKLKVTQKANHQTLKRGIEDANVPFCAPMQQYHGVIAQMAEDDVDYLFLPMVRGTARIGSEPWARLCPIVQGAPDMLIQDLGETHCKIVSPVVNIGKKNFESVLFVDSCRDIAKQFHVSHLDWKTAMKTAAAAQEAFDARCLDIGRHALDFCKTAKVTPVVVLGRTYTIYNDVLNSNVPAILREQGSIAIPIDCFPIDDDIPIFPKGYWGYGQRNLRAAHQIRRTPGLYCLYASNYSCGPDSFNIHFFTYIMEGKPCAIIETDGHSGDAGTKTRIEAFLYCVHEDQITSASSQFSPRDLMRLQTDTDDLADIRKRDATVLLPRMGPGAEVLAGALRGLGLKAESLPMPDNDALRLGRRHTSGKECFPMVITLGSLLQRLEQEEDKTRHFSFFMPTANGPCRFGSYNVLDRIVFERLNLLDRVSIWAPIDDDYFATVPPSFAAIAHASLTASDYLLEGLYTARPMENTPGAADAIWQFYKRELTEMLESYVRASSLSASLAVSSILSGSVFGITPILKRAASAFKEIMVERPIPEVLVTGEMYVRCDPFSNGFVIDQLEKRGIRCKFAAFNEWLEYTDYQDGQIKTPGDAVSSYLQAAIQHQLYYAMGNILGWHTRTTVQDSIAAAKPYIRENLSGESILTIGGPLHEWRHGLIDGTVSVGPLECMPNKISENQFYHIAEKEQLPSLTLYLNGDPVDPEILDNFAYEVHSQFKRRQAGRHCPDPPRYPRPPIWKPMSLHNPKDT